ncbi:MAG TPA: hypothetical protein VGN11_00230 [Candidatus Baltobacteraceae bacterium]|jgi:hypothetical protein|nr:hypothetical protein [Candidatus Baltobacteraceae bacterium]
MKRIFMTVAIAVLGLVLSFSAHSPVSAATTSGAAGITGDWVVQATGDKLIAGTLHLTRVGDTIVGTSKAGEGVLQINGEMKGNVLSAKWRGPKGNVGWMTLTFTSSMTGFQGSWGYGGRKPNGSIVGRQLAQTPF